MTHKLIFFIFAFVVLADQAFAQTPNISGVDGALDALKETTVAMQERMQVIARNLLMTLSAIEIVWMLAKSAIHGAGLGAVLAKLFFRVLIIGIALYFIQYMPQHVFTLLESANILAAEASNSKDGSSSVPTFSGILVEGLKLAGNLIKSVSLTSPATSIGLVIAALVTVILYAGIAAFVVMVYFELLILSIAGFILLAFFGLSATENSGKQYILSLIGKAIKLFTMLVIYGLTKEILNSVTTKNIDLIGALQIIAVLVVMLLLIQVVPGAAEGMIAGPATKTDGAEKAAGLSMKAAAGVAGVATGAALMGGGAGIAAAGQSLKANMGSGAGNMAKEALKAGLSAGGKGALKGGLSGGSGGLGNTAKAAILKKLGD